MKYAAWAVLLLFSAGLASAHAEMLFDAGAAQEHFKTGQDLYFKHDYKSAIKEFEEAIAIDPENADAYYYLGYSYYKLKDMEKAMAVFDEAYKVDSKYSPPRKTQSAEPPKEQE